MWASVGFPTDAHMRFFRSFLRRLSSNEFSKKGAAVDEIDRPLRAFF
jgi:hypothetical protein